MIILIVDDHPLLRAGLARLFQLEFGATVIEAATAADGLRQFRQGRPDVTVLDLGLPDQGGLSLLRKLRCDDPACRVVILSMRDDTLSAAACLRAGALAYISKSAQPETILEAMRHAIQGRPFLEAAIAQALAIEQITQPEDPLKSLAPQDIELLRLILVGKRTEQIASSLGIAEKTVANRKSVLRGKLGVQSDLELMKVAQAAGFAV